MRNASFRPPSRSALSSLHLAILVTTDSSTVSAYPIPPVPLWDLVARADLVVLAEVREVRRLTPEPEPDRAVEGDVIRTVLGPSRARLQVLENWKGDAVDVVEVLFEGNVICPAPPRYEVGKVVLTFLTRTEEPGTWRTVGLSYGTLYPCEDDLEDFRTLVREAIELQVAHPVPPADPERIDWSIRAASRPVTRWHGLYELAGRPFSWALDLDNVEEEALGPDALTPDQVRSVADAFLGDSRNGEDLALILRVLRGYPSREIDERAIAVVEGALATAPDTFGGVPGIEEVLRRFGDSDPEGRIAGTYQFDPLEWARAVRAVWEEARAALGIPRVQPSSLESNADCAMTFDVGVGEDPGVLDPGP